MPAAWYEVWFYNGKYAAAYICQLESSLEKSIFSKKENDFVKLVNARWLKETRRKRPQVVRLEDSSSRYGSVVFIPKKSIYQIYPMNPKSIKT